MNYPRGVSNSKFTQYSGASNNFDKVFVQHTPMIERHDYSNKNNVLHNNIGDKVMSEFITEYKIHINTIDRDTDIHPSPFKIKIPFSSASKSFSIRKEFYKIKYVSLDSVILPRTISIDSTHVAEPNLYPTNSDYSTSAAATTVPLSVLAKHRYLIVKINEFETDNTVGTSKLNDRDTFAIYPDTTLGIDSVMWKPLHNFRVVYPNSRTNNIRQLTLTIFDELGNELYLMNNSGNKIIGTVFHDGTDYNGFVENNKDIDSVNYTNMISQVEYNLTFGVVECEINTQTFD